MSDSFKIVEANDYVLRNFLHKADSDSDNSNYYIRFTDNTPITENDSFVGYGGYGGGYGNY